MRNSFGMICREWRKQKRYSQLQLALELGISSKHISFIETGRSIPSRELILKIGEFLFLPKKEVNRGLISAGFAPVYTQLAYGHAELKPVFHAIDQMLMNHMPYPALVLDQYWDVVSMNPSAESLMTKLGFSGFRNLIEAILSDAPDSSCIVNWREVVRSVYIRFRYEMTLASRSARHEELEGLLATALASQGYLDVNETAPISSVQLRLPDGELSFFSMIAQIGTVQDVTVSELKVELMFPTDEETKAYYE
ncbi:MAG: helix-turn-helix domain-containing protein [Arenicella sp.]